MGNPAAGVLVLLGALWLLLRFLGGELDSVFDWSSPDRSSPGGGFGGGSSGPGGGAGGGFDTTRPTSSGLPMATTV